MSNFQRGRILIIINQRGQNKQRKPKCMKPKSWNSNGKNKEWVQDKGHPNQKTVLDLYKKHIKNEKMQKKNEYF